MAEDSERNRLTRRVTRYARVGASVGGVAARMAGARLLGRDLSDKKNATSLAAANFTAARDDHPSRWRMLITLLAAAELFGMSVWFAAAAVGGQLATRLSVTSNEGSTAAATGRRQRHGDDSPSVAAIPSVARCVRLPRNSRQPKRCS